MIVIIIDENEDDSGRPLTYKYICASVKLDNRKHTSYYMTNIQAYTHGQTYLQTW